MQADRQTDHATCVAVGRILVLCTVMQSVNNQNDWKNFTAGRSGMAISCHYYTGLLRAAEYCDECVCLSVCLSAIISLELHIRSSPNFVCMLPTAVAQSSSGGVVICYVLPVLWMTSCLLISQGCSTSPPI